MFPNAGAAVIWPVEVLTKPRPSGRCEHIRVLGLCATRTHFTHEPYECIGARKDSCFVVLVVILGVNSTSSNPNGSARLGHKG